MNLGSEHNEFDLHFTNAAKAHCPPAWSEAKFAAMVKGVAAVETGGSFNPNAFVADDGGTGLSAVGVMQLLKVAVEDVRERAPTVESVAGAWGSLAEAQAAGDLRLKPAWAIDVGARYLASMSTRYHHDDPWQALACYNGGPSFNAFGDPTRGPVLYANKAMASAERFRPVEGPPPPGDLKPNTIKFSDKGQWRRGKG